MCFLMVYGCSELEDTWDRWMGNDDDDEKTEVASAEPQQAEQPKAAPKEKEPEKLPTPKKNPTPKTTSSYSTYYHHYNPQAWKGKGVALVLCPKSSKMDSCNINGKGMYLHGSRDKGRYVYTRRGKTGISGVVSCKKGSKVYKFKVKGGRSIQYGKCR
jgi:hypothetical protein